MKKHTNIVHRIGHFLWTIFLGGLITILPLTLTIVIFNTVFKALIFWLQPIKQLEPEFLRAIPYAELFIAIAIILAFGTILNFFLLHKMFHFIEALIFRIPLIRPVYSGIKQLVQAFNPKDHESFKEVVVVQFPRAGIYSLGFVTSEVPKEIAPHATSTFFNIFIPTTPNPTTGYFVMVEEHEFKTISLTRQEAMAMIISGGIIQPDRFSNGKQ